MIIRWHLGEKKRQLFKLKDNRKIKVALVGNPNSGKSSLFNALTGLNQKIGNFPGVTVEKKIGHFVVNDQKYEIVDLPGMYSIHPKSTDEVIAFDAICNPLNTDAPDCIIVVADATNLKRNLLFITQIIDLQKPVILALNMIDLIAKNGISIDLDGLSKALGIPVIGISARNKKGITELKTLLANLPSDSHKLIYNNDRANVDIYDALRAKFGFSISDFNAELLFQHGNDAPELPIVVRNFINDYKEYNPVNYHKDQALETIGRYKIVAKIMGRFIDKTPLAETAKNSKLIDKIILHNVWGYVLFFVVLFIIFQVLYSIAQYPMDWIENGFGALSAFLSHILPTGWLTSLAIDGIVAGLAGVVVFVPQIAILFFFISILEDTGYMARASFLMDGMMRKFGLNGKSVVPLISGLACAIPAIMATRSISSWKERMLTILVTPLMSCSARLPVYILLIGIAVPSTKVLGIFNLQGLTLMGFYVLGFVMAIVSAWVLNIAVKEREISVFIMELPIYRMPRWSNIAYNIWNKCSTFVLEAGKVIIAVSIVLWALASFGPGDSFNQIDNKYSAALSDSASMEQAAELVKKEKLENSYAGVIGKSIAPVIAPLGYDWKIGIAIITSFAAREVFVGTMSTLYSLGGDEDLEDSDSLRDRMKAAKNPDTGLPVFTFASAISLMIFYAFAMQCMSTLAVVKKETGHWKWAAFQFVFLTALAYCSSLLVFQLLK